MKYLINILLFNYTIKFAIIAVLFFFVIISSSYNPEVNERINTTRYEATDCTPLVEEGVSYLECH